MHSYFAATWEAIVYRIYDTECRHLATTLAPSTCIIVQGGPKIKPDNFCNNFVYCQPIFIIFGTYTL